MGLLFAGSITYRYFSSPSISGGNEIIGATRRRVSKILEPTLMRRTIRDSCMTSTAFSSGDKSEQHDSQQHVASNMESSTECSFSETPKPNQGQRSSEEFRQSFSFNIFDGTAPSKSQWAKFIFEGDESDEENDLEETRHWAGCQDM